MKILSWNVLHQAHEREFNPNSRILRAYSDDAARLGCIVDVLKQHVTKETIISLQECSAELLAMLNSGFKSTHDLLSQKIGNDEYLITLTPRFLKCSHDGPGTIPTGANGYFSVSNGVIRIINCHLKPQFTVKNKNVLGVIGGESASKLTVVAGDFNEKSGKVKKALGTKFIIPHFGRSYKKQKGLDYIIFNRQLRFAAGLIPTELLSDHDPVSLEFLL